MHRQCGYQVKQARLASLQFVRERLFRARELEARDVVVDLVLGDELQLAPEVAEQRGRRHLVVVAEPGRDAGDSTTSRKTRAFSRARQRTTCTLRNRPER